MAMAIPTLALLYRLHTPHDKNTPRSKHNNLAGFAMRKVEGRNRNKPQSYLDFDYPSKMRGTHSLNQNRPHKNVHTDII